MSPYTIQESHHADAKYYFPVEGSDQRLGRTAPAVDVLVKPGVTLVAEARNLIMSYPPADARGASSRRRRNLVRRRSALTILHYGEPSCPAETGSSIPISLGASSSTPAPSVPLLLKARLPSSTTITLRRFLAHRLAGQWHLRGSQTGAGAVLRRGPEAHGAISTS